MPYSVGAKSRDRTGDPTIFSRVLYQLSYLGTSVGLAFLSNSMSGGPGRIRTYDFLGVNKALWPLSYWAKLPSQ